MNYALVENDQIVSVDLPEIGTLPDGSQVSGFNKLDSETLKEAGWLPIEDTGPPTYDPSSMSLTRTIEIKKGKVVAVYHIFDLPPVVEPLPSPPSVEERLIALETKIQELEAKPVEDTIDNI